MPSTLTTSRWYSRTLTHFHRFRAGVLATIQTLTRFPLPPDTLGRWWRPDRERIHDPPPPPYPTAHPRHTDLFDFSQPSVEIHPSPSGRGRGRQLSQTPSPSPIPRGRAPVPHHHGNQVAEVPGRLRPVEAERGTPGCLRGRAGGGEARSRRRAGAGRWRRRWRRCGCRRSCCGGRGPALALAPAGLPGPEEGAGPDKEPDEGHEEGGGCSRHRRRR